MIEKLNPRDLYNLCLDFKLNVPKNGKIKKQFLLNLLNNFKAKVFAIGIENSKKVVIHDVCSETFFSGCLEYETKSVAWLEYMMKRCEIHDFDICILDNPRLIDNSTKSCKIFVSNIILIPKKGIWLFETTLVNKKYTYVTDEIINIDGNEIVYKVFSKHRKKQKPRAPVLKNIDIRLVKGFAADLPDTSLTMSKFKILIKTEKFQEDYKKSLINLYEHKLIVYRKLHSELNKSNRKMKIDKNKMVEKGLSEMEVEKIFSGGGDSIILSIHIESMIERIKIKKLEVDKINVCTLLTHVLEEMNIIVGRENIKNIVMKMLYAFSKSHRVFTDSFVNFCITGCSGVGKTAVAKMISNVFAQSNIFIDNNISIVSRTDLVGSFVGQTAIKTKSLLVKSLEGVLFIDEAYQLAGFGNDFGSESITEIVNFLDKYIGLGCVIVAGYKDKMFSRFFPCNEGLNRRFPYKVHLENYSSLELTVILFKNIFVELTDNDRDYLFSIVSYLNTNNVFDCQAGDILNLAQEISISILSSEKNTMDILQFSIQKFLRTKNLDIEKKEF